MTTIRAIALASLAAAAILPGVESSTLAQVATLQNGGFETRFACNPLRPLGWRFYNAPTIWRHATEPLAQPLPPGITPYEGDGMLELGPGTDFAGAETEDRMVTNTADCFNPPAILTYPFNWPAYTYEPELDGDPTNNTECFDTMGSPVSPPPDPVNTAAGDPITISGRYLIPAASPLVNTRSGLKVVFRSNFIDFPGQFGGFFVKEVLSIDGYQPGGVHTNGQWVEYTLTVDQTEFFDPQGCWPPPIGGNGYLSVVVVRFGDVGSTGVIYWDDIRVSQGAACPLDLSGNGIVDADDIFAFLNIWFAGPPGGTCSGCTADWDGNGTITADDIFAFLNQWFAFGPGQPCP